MKLLYREFFEHRYFYLVIGLLCCLMILTLPASMRGADGREYLRWTHSFVFDQDVHLLNNAEAVGSSYKLTPTGYVFERVNIGAPLMWSPFLAIATLFLPDQADDALYPAENAVYLVWLNFTSWLYPILGGLFLVGALRRLFAADVVTGAIIAVLFGTPVLFYMMTFPMSAHPALIFLSSVLLYLWLSNRLAGHRRPDGAISNSIRSPSGALHYFIVGIVIGWMMLVASYSIIFFLLPVFDLLESFVHKRDWQRTLRNALAIGVGGLAGFLPQMIVWWLMFGRPFSSPYSGQLFWSEPYLFGTLFSTFHGLFFFAPVLLFVIPGLWWWRKSSWWTALSLGLSWLALTYIVSVNVAWWAGASFGNRYFLVLSPFFVLGLAVFLQNGKRWAFILAGACVLWTVGLYLQFLDGVGFTSDSIVYSAAELTRGQFVAWSNTLTVLPQLVINRPWHLVPKSIPLILILSLISISRIFYGWIFTNCKYGVNSLGQMIIIVLSVVIILFTGLASVRAERVKTLLTEQGFYDQPHQTVVREIKEVAGKAGLVTRALYHRQTGHPEKAIADLRLASEWWKPDTAEYPNRLYLGPTAHLPNDSSGLGLDYPGNVRLIDYRIIEANRKYIEGELYWKKLDGPKSNIAATPIVRAFDHFGNLVGRTEVEFPFPAEYIPAGDYFKDSFRLNFDHQPDSWIWLGVMLKEDFALPLDVKTQIASDIITSINLYDSLLTMAEVPASQPVIRVEPLFGKNLYPTQVIPIQFLEQGGSNVASEIALEISMVATSAGQPVATERYPLQPTHHPSSQTLCFLISPELPAGDYLLAIGQVPPATVNLVNSRGLSVKRMPVRIQRSPATAATLPGQKTICELLQAKFPRRYEPTTPRHPVKARLTDEITLAGYELSVISGATAISASIVLHWHVQADVTGDFLVSVRLLDAGGQVVTEHTAIPVHQTRPTLTWRQDEWILDEHVLEIPALVPGDYQLSLSLIDSETGQPVRIFEDHSALILEELRIP